MWHFSDLPMRHRRLFGLPKMLPSDIQSTLQFRKLYFITKMLLWRRRDIVKLIPQVNSCTWFRFCGFLVQVTRWLGSGSFLSGLVTAQSGVCWVLLFNLVLTPVKSLLSITSSIVTYRTQKEEWVGIFSRIRIRISE